MRNVILAMLIAAGFAMLGSASSIAAAVNGSAVDQAVKQSDQVIHVADGCGRGRHWSRYRGRCVWN